MARLEGKVAFVTGAAGGIGREIALAMAREGATVAMSDINADLLEQSVAEAGLDTVRAVPLDVADRAAVMTAIDAHAERCGGLDILVNNAVRFHYAPMVDFPPDIAAHMLDVGIKGVYWCLQAATPHLVARGGGAIINLSSIAVSMAIKNGGVYSSIKGAIDALTRQQADELGPHDIRVNALAPGPVPTPGASAVIDEAGWAARAQKSMLGRLPTAGEIGEAAVFLASDAARSITGVTLKVDAGVTIKAA
ncbi:SDR family NAD(P)-dependent oxidoreductase [Acuticoccus sp. I52.16.1]|uniref:SDR family NAD(P)-dependent oxidoreductase n=1 Tax=Acuticoccus sp. I52.16.1 TaxID=2928472 RepID=UPI001FD0FC5F|nr:SDR family oxidoreductase [Acuticoccus sp. I52.16.1]UOM35012.1 SDR family oxidoreductase [Acuticoccus sp. I52.16.1]